MTARTLLRVRNVVALNLACFLTTVSAFSDEFFLKDGDRVVFYGDSITFHRRYTALVETYVLTRFPAMEVSFITSGWPGDRVTGGWGGNIDTRLSRDVHAHRPTVATVMLGMNDAGSRAFDQSLFDNYKNGLAGIIQKIRASNPGVRLTLIAPSPYDDVTRQPRFAGGYNSILIRYGQAVRELAEETGQTFVDFNAPVVALLSSAKATNPALAAQLIPDRVHPSPATHLVMAAALLKTWNAPATVTDVEIDAGTSHVVRAQNTRIADLRAAANTLSWTQSDTALPMPVDITDPQTALVLAHTDFTNTLNRQPLRITGLAVDTTWEIQIDGKRIGSTWTAKQLAEGINLAPIATPMTAQASEVHKLTTRRTDLYHTRYYLYQVPYANASDPIRKHLPDVLHNLDAAIKATAAMQRAAARPLPRHYLLKAIPPI